MFVCVIQPSVQRAVHLSPPSWNPPPLFLITMSPRYILLPFRLDIRVGSLNGVLSIPVWRDFLMAMGVVSVSRESLRYNLRNGKVCRWLVWGRSKKPGEG